LSVGADAGEQIIGENTTVWQLHPALFVAAVAVARVHDATKLEALSDNRAAAARHVRITGEVCIIRSVKKYS
jgi:hypothetical protein